MQNSSLTPDTKISKHNFGNFKLDAGSMFGPVPKAIWSKIVQTDQLNRLLMASNSLIIETDDRKIIIDGGPGNKFDQKYQDIYGISDINFLDEPESVTDVIITHLHFDHVGGLSNYQDEKIIPVYPNATYHLQKSNYELAKNPNPREKSSYLAENIAILNEDNTRLYEDSYELIPGINIYVSDGHTKGLQWLTINHPDKKYIFASDLVPTQHHLRLNYHMGFDMNTEKLLIDKQNLLDLALQSNYEIILQHDPEVFSHSL